MRALRYPRTGTSSTSTAVLSYPAPTLTAKTLVFVDETPIPSVDGTYNVVTVAAGFHCYRCVCVCVCVSVCVLCVCECVCVVCV